MTTLAPAARGKAAGPLPPPGIVSRRAAVLVPSTSRALPCGAPGELCIGGPGLAGGYLNRPEKTREAFIHDIERLSGQPSERLYRTGDLARVDARGEIEYLGRIDSQVKSPWLPDRTDRDRVGTDGAARGGAGGGRGGRARAGATRARHVVRPPRRHRGGGPDEAEVVCALRATLPAYFEIPRSVARDAAPEPDAEPSVRAARLRAKILDEDFWRHERYWKLSTIRLLALFDGTPMKPWLFRLAGVRMGRRVYDGGCGIPEKSLVTVGDGCTLNEGSVLQGHSLEDGRFKSDRIVLGSRCTVGPRAFVHYASVLGEGCRVDADAFLMKGERPSPGSVWRGNPASELLLVSSTPDARAGGGRTDREHRVRAMRRR